MKAGELIVIGARPSVGKTALALATCLSLTSNGIPVHFFSLEMSRGQVTDRIFSMRSGVPLTLILRGKIGDDEATKINETANIFRREPFRIDDRHSLTATRLCSIARRAVRKHKVQLIAVDYLQLITSENPKEQRYLQVGMMALKLKQLARSCGIPVLLLAQLNRESEKRSDGKPKLSDLRESGDVEAHADVVLLPYPAPEDSGDKTVKLINVLVAKNRNGPTGEVTLCYRNQVVKFENAPA
jgi:replicative DNA helicase